MGDDAAGDWPVVGRDALDAVAALVARSVDDAPTADELERALFAPQQPAVLRGDPDRGVVATVRSVDDPSTGFVRLLVVDPSVRRAGVGAALLRAAEDDLADAHSITVGADPPFHLFPGVAAGATEMLCLLERARYRRVDTTFNMTIDLAGLPEQTAGAVVATASDRADVAAMLAANYPNWTHEALRALDQGSLVIERDADGAVAAFCAHDVNRAGTLGPVAARLDLVGTGAGRGVLVHALHRQRAAGATCTEVLWVGPIRPYAALGGRISDVFFVYRKTRRRST